MRDTDLVIIFSERRLTVMLHHLGQHEIGEGPAVAIKTLSLGVRIYNTATADDLSSEFVEQIGVLVVGDFVPPNQWPDDASSGRSSY